MKLRDLILSSAAVAGLVIAPTLAAASQTAATDTQQPLTAGGPAAQSENGPAIGSIVEIGGALFVVTVAGLVALSNDNGSTPTATTSTTTTH